MGADKRKHPRVRARGVAANVRAQEVLKTGCVVENISAGGLLVRTDQLLEVGTPVVMDLVRPGMKKLLKLSGRVVGRVERPPGPPVPGAPSPGLRVRFDPMPDETTDRLVQLLTDLGLAPGQPSPASAPAPTPAVSPSAPFGPPFLPADAHQISWGPPEGLETTRAMSAEAVMSALQAAEAPAPPPTAEPPQSREIAQAALAPPPIMPVPAAPAAAPRAEASPGAPASAPADTRLMVQIRGLLMELGDVQTRLDTKDRETSDLGVEVERLRRENQELRERLARAEEQLRSQGVKDPGDRF